MLLEIPLADATAALPVFDTTDIAEILNQGIRQVGSVLTTSTRPRKTAGELSPSNRATGTESAARDVFARLIVGFESP
ncbi:hypothetical protein LAUMK35_01730 [Mycobacterium pseudokansasii]|nr:hypothetical protein LAUMK35_01730 [Mycobacterium pseudokansasii]VAZ92695.1 hypothetical protein LAUMK21_01729 [Mycobacterium pseudokansasii]